MLMEHRCACQTSTLNLRREPDAEDAPQARADDHGQEDQDRVHAQCVALDLGCQEVALQLLNT
jgi:hypothetical protein